MDKLIRQHNAITEARYEMSALEKNIIYLLMAEIKEGNEATSNYYKIRFSDLQNRLGEKIRMQELLTAANNLVRRSYVIRTDSGVLNTSIISSVENLPEEGKIELGVGSMVYPYLCALKRHYTEFQLDIALKLKSIYAKRLYEMLSQHKEVGSLKISLKELKWRLALLDDKDSSKEKYANWSTFEGNVLFRSQKDINKNTNLSFSWKSIKTGKKYTDLVFSITSKSS